MATPPPPPLKIDLWSLREEYSRIIKAHSCHFNALSVLFLLPFSISLSLYPFLIIQLFPQSSTPTTIQSHLSFLLPNIKLLVLNLLCILSITIFFLLASGSVTHSLFHSFYGRPIKLVSSIKAAFSSFFPLLSTCVVQELMIFGIGLIMGLSFFSLIKAATQIVGFHVNYSSSCFTLLCLVYATILMFLVVYFQVNWILAYVIVQTHFTKK